MEIFLMLVFAGGVILALAGIANFSSEQVVNEESNADWRELQIERRHPGSDWVYLPKFHYDNECKLACIPALGHLEAEKQLIKGCCQTNANWSLLTSRQAGLGSQKLTPFSKRGVTLSFEDLAAVDVAVEIEMIVE